MTKFLLVLENFNIPAGSDYEYVVIAIIGQTNISCHQKVWLLLWLSCMFIKKNKNKF